MLATSVFYFIDRRGIVRDAIVAASLFVVALAIFAVVATVTPLILAAAGAVLGVISGACVAAGVATAAWCVAIAPTVGSFLGCVVLLVAYVYATKPKGA